MATPRILVVGSLNADLVTRTPVVPKGGETLTASSFSTGSGGKGANQAVAAARASRKLNARQDKVANVSMVGAVGNDIYGKQLLSDLESDGIDVSGVALHHDETTGVAVILVEEGSGENRILFTPGANAKVKPEQFSEFIEQMKVDLVILQLETPIETVLSIIEIAKKRSISVLLNPAPAVKLPEACFRDLNHLVMNETEAAILAGWDGDAVDENVLKDVFQKFADLGVRNTIITLGAKGVAWSTDGNFAQIPAEKVEKVVDTTAAGDTWVGYYAVEVAKSEAASSPWNVKAAVMKANKAAAKTVQRAGAQTSIPWMDEV